MNKSVASLLFGILMIQATTPTFAVMTVIVKKNQHDRRLGRHPNKFCSSTINTQRRRQQLRDASCL